MIKKPIKPAVQVSSRPFSGTPSIKWTLGCGSPELVWSKAKIKRSAKSWAKVSKSPMYHSGVMLQKGPRRSSISRWADKRPPRTRILASKTWTVQANHDLRNNFHTYFLIIIGTQTFNGNWLRKYTQTQDSYLWPFTTIQAFQWHLILFQLLSEKWKL